MVNHRERNNIKKKNSKVPQTLFLMTTEKEDTGGRCWRDYVSTGLGTPQCPKEEDVASCDPDPDEQ